MAYYNNPFYPQNFYPNIQQAQQQVQNGGFVVIPSEDMVVNYPVAVGNCVTFKIEGKPIVMEKTGGQSQFDTPKITRYRLVKEDVPEPSNLPEKADNDIDTVKTTINKLNGEIEAIWGEINGIKNAGKKPQAKKKEVNDDDSE